MALCLSHIRSYFIEVSVDFFFLTSFQQHTLVCIISNSECANRSGSYDYWILALFFFLNSFVCFIQFWHTHTQRLQWSDFIETENVRFALLKFDIINYVSIDSQQILFDSKAHRRN